MPFAVELALDQVASQTIESIWNDLAEQKITDESNQSRMHPHITLAIYEKLDCVLCEQELTRLVQDTHQLKLNFSHFGVFTQPENVLFLAPSMTDELFQLQRQVHACLERKSIGSWENYQPGKWVPHCTLAFNIGGKELSKAMDIVLKQKLPLYVSTESLGVTEFYPAENAFRIPFKTY